ncbi:MAG: hypothetical protein DI529_03125 [Chryseobacterium sp.]|nr:MAG: hypothetical protein DI529_03125 [Chryseobacterium sp.]
MRKIHTLILLLFIFVGLNAQETYQNVTINYKDNNQLKNILEILEADHFIRNEKEIRIIIPRSKAKILQNQGITFKITDIDVQKTHQKKLADELLYKNPGINCYNFPVYITPSNYKTGSMAGYLNYDEVLSELDLMTSLFPNLITGKSPIGNFLTSEERPIYNIKISDNPNLDENENRVLFTALHHAREPGSMQQLIFFMWYLLENYNSDVQIKKLIDNTEIYFVPVVNPDGYVYNQTTNPNGGGMWRKNRRDNNNGSFGVDLNRNYGYEWGGSGSSTYTTSESYRGPYAFSEPETQAIKWLCETKNFKVAINNHNSGNIFLYPNSYTTDPSPDENIFKMLSDKFVEKTNYINGSFSNVLYLGAGNSDDWMYSDISSKPKIFSFTPEIGDDFWDTPSKTEVNVNKMLSSNLAILKVVNNYGQFKDNSFGNISDVNYDYQFTFQKIGFGDNGSFNVKLIPISSNISSVSEAKNYSNLTLGQTVNDSFAISLNPNIISGDEVIFKIIINNGIYDEEILMSKRYAEDIVKFYDDCTTLDQWNATGIWGVYQLVTPAKSLTNNPTDTNITTGASHITTKQFIDLTNSLTAKLTYRVNWSVMENGRYAGIQVSEDGINWVNQCGKRTTVGTSSENYNQPIYSGFTNEWKFGTWTDEEINLSEYVGKKIYLRYKSVMPGPYSSTQGVIKVDEIKVTAIDNKKLELNESFTKKISIYPNPVENVLFIKNADSNIYKIHSTTGQMIQQGIISNGQIFVSKLVKGLYFISIKNNSNKDLKIKFIKK